MGNEDYNEEVYFCRIRADSYSNQRASLLGLPGHSQSRWNLSARSEGGVLLKGKKPSPKTHHKYAFSTLISEAVITKQQGRIIHGAFESPTGDTEKFVAGIGLDNKTIYFADEDRLIEGKILDKDY